MSWFKRLFRQPESSRGAQLTHRVKDLEVKAERIVASHERQEVLNRELRAAYYHIMGDRRAAGPSSHNPERRR